MKRHEWKFGYTGSDLLAAADTKHKHHKDRLAWWEEQEKKVMEKVRAEGLEVRESVAAKYSTSNVGHGAEIVVDVQLQQKLNECHAKKIEHQNKVKEYSGWMQVLEMNKNERLELNHDDVLFFFGK